MHHGFTKAMAIATAAALSLLPVTPAVAGDSKNGDTLTPIKHLAVSIKYIHIAVFDATLIVWRASQNGRA